LKFKDFKRLKQEIKMFSSLRKEVESLPSCFLMLSLRDLEGKTPNSEGWIEVRAQQVFDLFALTGNELRNSLNELIKKGLIERKREGKYPFIRLTDRGNELLDVCGFHRDPAGNSSRMTPKIHRDGPPLLSISNSSSLKSINNNIYNNTIRAKKDSSVTSDEVILEEFSEWWNNWSLALKRMPSGLREKCKTGLRHRAESKFLKLRRQFTLDQIRLVSKRYILEKRKAGHQTQHAERFLHPDLMKQYLAEIQTEQVADVEETLSPSIDLSKGLYAS
jgi:DNA-binding MarR family transcriptional regulator